MACALCWLAALAAGGPSAAQSFVSPEVQAYPAGFVGRVGVGSGSGAWSWALLAGYNATNRRDWGEHDNEEGGGPGAGLRVIRNSATGVGLYGEARLDLWFLEIDWTDNGALPRSGTSQVRVVQPTVGGGYQWQNGWGHLRVGAAFGWEVNTGLQGEAVGEGPILIGGLQLDLVRPR